MSLRKYCNTLFIYFIFATLIFVFTVNLKIVWIDRFAKNKLTVCYLLIFLVSTIMLVWSLLKTMFTDPGKVP